MSKKAFLFSGQGAQFVGMGKDLYDNFDIAKKYFDEAENILNKPIKTIIFEGPEETLKQTENTQPAVMLMSYVAYKILESEGITADAFAGFSLGEYSALTAAGILSFGQSAVAAYRPAVHNESRIRLHQNAAAESHVTVDNAGRRFSRTAGDKSAVDGQTSVSSLVRDPDRA